MQRRRQTERLVDGLEPLGYVYVFYFFPLLLFFSFSLQGNSTFTEFPDCTLTIHTFNKYRCKYAHPYVHENTS